MLEKLIQNKYISNRSLSKNKQDFINQVLKKNDYSNPQFLGKNYNYTKFILLSTPRTGSSYVLSSLKSHSSIASYSELFLNNKVGFGYYNFHEDNKLIKIRNNYTSVFLNSLIFRGYKENIQSVGFKLFYNQYNENIKFKKRFNNYLKKQNVKIIHLIRTNFFDSYISYMFAKKNNVWRIFEDDVVDYLKKNKVDIIPQKEQKNTRKYKPVTIDYTECLNYFEQQKQNIQYFRNLYKENQSLEIYYNDVKNDYNNTMNRILDFLEVERQQLNSPLAKQNTKKKTEIIINYFELKKQFENTEYYHFFDE